MLLSGSGFKSYLPANGCLKSPNGKVQTKVHIRLLFQVIDPDGDEDRDGDEWESWLCKFLITPKTKHDHNILVKWWLLVLKIGARIKTTSCFLQVCLVPPCQLQCHSVIIRMLLQGSAITKNLAIWSLPKQEFNSPFTLDRAICGIYLNKSLKTVISTMLMDILPMNMVKNVLCVLFWWKSRWI